MIISRRTISRDYLYWKYDFSAGQAWDISLLFKHSANSDEMWNGKEWIFEIFKSVLDLCIIAVLNCLQGHKLINWIVKFLYA